MKKAVYVVLIMISIIALTGCNLFKEKTNKDSEVVKIKNTMLNELDSFDYSATIEIETDAGNIPTTLTCKQDNINQITYCKTNTMVVSIEEYVDIKNKKVYTKTTNLFGENNNTWEVTSFKGNINNSNSWLNLNDYIFNLEVVEKDGGKYYTGVISNKKLGEAMSKADSTLKFNNLIKKDVPITVFINSSDYIEYMNFEIDIFDIKQKVTIKYSNFNQAGSVTIPEYVKG